MSESYCNAMQCTVAWWMQTEVMHACKPNPPGSDCDMQLHDALGAEELIG